ncbi:hypothetical protein [Vibrio tapetis]|uniref:Uncharacterized protein n=1 Tax=Vibrio tapetis subsp. tapetis TaxID=1671868 RepID=A0A2N8ZCR0_9VIBR|nr:hypothetical protein [Vibrio tapetis]SON49691.1 conserved protein of unknown function [Vibrio tapetis subsp. tapetis]
MGKLTSLALIEKVSPMTLLAINPSFTFRLPNPNLGLLIVEVQPAALADSLISQLTKNMGVELAHKVQDGRSGWLVVYSDQREQLRAAADAIYAQLGNAQTPDELLCSSIVNAISPEHAQTLNKQNQRVRFLPGNDLLTIDCKPAIAAIRIANQIEKNSNCQIQAVKYLGSSGRLMVTGKASDISACPIQI